MGGEGRGGRERGKGKGREIRTPLRIGLVTGLKCDENLIICIVHSETYSPQIMPVSDQWVISFAPENTPL